MLCPWLAALKKLEVKLGMLWLLFLLALCVVNKDKAQLRRDINPHSTPIYMELRYQSLITHIRKTLDNSFNSANHFKDGSHL